MRRPNNVPQDEWLLAQLLATPTPGRALITVTDHVKQTVGGSRRIISHAVLSQRYQWELHSRSPLFQAVAAYERVAIANGWRTCINSRHPHRWKSWPFDTGFSRFAETSECPNDPPIETCPNHAKRR